MTKAKDFSSLLKMKKALLRFLGIIVTTCALTFTLLMAIRWLGSGQEYSQVENALMKRAPFVILEAALTKSEPAPQSLASLKALSLECPTCILRIDSRLSLDDVPYVFAKDDLEPTTGEIGYFSLKTSQEIDRLTYSFDSSSRIARLDQVMSELPDSAFFVVIHSRDASKLRHFLKALEPRDTQETLILDSPYRQILKEARQLRPRWLFSTPPSYLMRLQVMSALGVETMADIWPDLLVFDPSATKDQPSESLLKEYRGRFKKVVVKTNQALTAYPASKFGIFTENLDLVRQLFAVKAKTETATPSQK